MKDLRGRATSFSGDRGGNCALFTAERRSSPKVNQSPFNVINDIKKGMNAWQAVGSIKEGLLLRSVSKAGKVGKSLSDLAIWSVVTEAAKEIGIERFGPSSAAYLREALPQGWWGLAADQGPAGAFVDPAHRALPRLGAGDRYRRK